MDSQTPSGRRRGSASCTCTICHIDNNDRIDAIIGLPYAQKGGAQTVGIDTTVTCPAVPSLVCVRATQNPSYATDEAERRKSERHRAHCEAGRMEYETGAMTTYGGWGGGFLARFVKLWQVGEDAVLDVSETSGKVTVKKLSGHAKAIFALRWKWML